MTRPQLWAIILTLNFALWATLIWLGTHSIPWIAHQLPELHDWAVLAWLGVIASLDFLPIIISRGQGNGA